MKRRIAIDQIEAGMYLVGFEGFWLLYPFWRTKFVLTQADISEIRASGVKAVFIDDEKGAAPICVTAPTPPAPLSPPPAPAKRMEAARHWRSFTAPSPSPRRLIVDVDEVQRATEAIQRSKRVIMRMFGEARMGKAVALRDVEPIVDEIAESVIRDAAAMIKVTRLKRKNEYTYLHSVAVCALMINLGRQLGLAESLTRDLGIAGLMHDIGKMSVPGTVLDKPGSLNNDEFEIIRAHPQKGHELLLMTEGISPIALDVCLHHHERVDGTGYPFGLTAEQLSLHARMGAVCDVYDAVTSRRPTRIPGRHPMPWRKCSNGRDISIPTCSMPSSPASASILWARSCACAPIGSGSSSPVMPANRPCRPCALSSPRRTASSCRPKPSSARRP